MDVNHAKITVKVHRVAGEQVWESVRPQKQGKASVAVDGPKDLLMSGLAMLIWRLAKEIGLEPEALCDNIKRVFEEDRIKIGGRDKK